MVDARIRVVGPAEQQQDDAVALFGGLDQLEATALEIFGEPGEGLPSLLDGEVTFVFGDAQPLAPGLEHLPLEVGRLGQVECGVDVGCSTLVEEVDLLGEGGLDDVGCAGDDRARRGVHRPFDERGDVGQRGEEDVVERLPLLEEQMVDMSLHHLRGIAGVDGAVLGAGLEELLRGDR